MTTTAGPSRAQSRLFKSLALMAARAADDKKGIDVRLLDVRKVSGLADFILIVGVTSPPHLSAVDDAVRKILKDAGAPALHRDGRQSDSWRVVDFGGLIVHLMHPTAREFYAIEKIYHGAKNVSYA